MTAWPLLCFSLCLLLPLGARADAFQPDVAQDRIGTEAQVGKAFLLQTLSINKHFVVDDDGPNTYFMLKDNPDLADAGAKKDFTATSVDEQKEQERQRDLLNLSWMLGYAYYRTDALDPVSGTTVYDDAHTIKLGLSWEAAGMFNLTMAGAYEVMPAEDYSQGMYDLSASFTIPLQKQPDVEGDEPISGSNQDAETYYVNQARAAERPHLNAIQRFPNLEVALIGGYGRHTKSTTDSGRLAGVGITSDQIVNSAGSGPQLTLNVNPRLNFRFRALYYYYDASVGQFLGNFTIGAFRPKADLAIADLDGTTPLLLTFPTRSISAAASLRPTPTTTLQLDLIQSAYTPTSTTGAGALINTVSVGGELNFILKGRWKLGGALDLTFGTAGYNAVTGGAALSYAL